MFKRWILQRIGKEKYNSKPTLKFLIYNIKWVFEFNGTKRTLLDELDSYGEKCKIFIHSKDAMKFVENIYG